MSKKHKNKQSKPVEQPIKVANVVKEKKKWFIHLPHIHLSSLEVYLTNGLVSIAGSFSTRFRAMVTGLITPFVLLQSGVVQLAQTVHIRLLLTLDSLSTMKSNEIVRQYIASAIIVIVGSFLVMKVAGM